MATVREQVANVFSEVLDSTPMSDGRTLADLKPEETTAQADVFLIQNGFAVAVLNALYALADKVQVIADVTGVDLTE